jgi:hypothetical protein
MYLTKRQLCMAPAYVISQVEITGNPSALMQYTNYEEDIVQRYGIELQGWTYERFVNPSELSTAIGPLRILLGAIKNGDCKFVKLSAKELRKRLEKYKEKVDAGEIRARKRKRRSDYGTKKKGKGKETVDDDDTEDSTSEDDDDEVGPSKKRPRATDSATAESDSE